MNLEYSEAKRKNRIANGLRRRLAGLRERDSGIWRYGIVLLWMLSGTAAALAALGMPTGFGTTFDVVAGFLLSTAGMAISSWTVAVLLALAGARVPRFTIGGFLYTGVIVYCVLMYSDLGWKASLVFSAACTLVTLAIGLAVGAIAVLSVRRRLLAIGVAALAALVTIVSIVGVSQPASEDRAADGDREVAKGDGEVRALSVIPSDPSQQGSYSYRYLTYGSGKDKHRADFGEQADMRSSSVDASAYIKDWPWLRKQFWGFDETALPLNGRAWMPDGDGPFPVVLMVHGNHLMENFSDDGYGYLGELLASRGIAAISVDENFLNYSTWSGIPDQDMKLRAWMLLKHIQLLESYNEQEDSPFYNRLDLERIGLLGHSRGGQAAAMAADAERWFSEDADLPKNGTYRVKAVIALAPTDTEVDGGKPELRDISYLTLQGAKDADLVNFYGDRQYGRVSFSGHTDAFKASLYIEDANHSQFNTSWGRSDNALPAGLFIRPKKMLEAEDQRQIANIYVSAFAEAVFHQSKQYDALFRDYRAGSEYLPETRYFNQYEDGDFRPLVDFEGEDRTSPSPGVAAEATNLTEWRQAEALNRQGESKEGKGAVLEWRDEASFSLQLVPSLVGGLDNDEILMFSLANMGRELEANTEAFEDPDEIEALQKAVESPLSIDIELEDLSGHSARLPLDEFMQAEPQVATEFTWLPRLEAVVSEGKFKDTEEPVFQTYELPLKDFTDANPDFDPAEWTRITFHFNEGPGKVMLGNVGLTAG
ncbi:alpha/beta hydrolase [Cohnella terricola]|uniref:Alpha/beta hydrolase n=1 Tax=Cohnella terricola TaxID=1289167 RepID=A0A559JIH1_9BACL|nr:alpha/beta hydrolase [Cohnella terricola]TVX99673.1 alpha/beta hydrolase [Cohnella terricola]